MKYSLSSSWWNSFHIFSLLLSHILHLLQPLLCLWKMGFCLKVSSCHTCPHDNNLITKDLGQMPLLPHKQMYTHTNTYTCFEKHLVERLCTVIRNWLKVCWNCVFVWLLMPLYVFVFITHWPLPSQYHLPCKWVDERVTVQRSSRMNYYQKTPYRFHRHTSCITHNYILSRVCQLESVGKLLRNLIISLLVTLQAANSYSYVLVGKNRWGVLIKWLISITMTTSNLNW